MAWFAGMVRCYVAGDRAFATRLAWYCARNPVALERLTYDRSAKAVMHRSDKLECPTAGTETADPLEFLAPVLVQIPDKGHITTPHVAASRRQPSSPGTPVRRPHVDALYPDSRSVSQRGPLLRAESPPYPRTNFRYVTRCG